MTYFLDTNIFLRYFVEDEQSQFVISNKIIQKICQNKLDVRVPGIVFSETVWGLHHYNYTKADILRVTQAILTLRIPIVDNYDYSWANETYTRKNIKFVDCLIASIPDIRDKKSTILSFDKDFKKLDVLWEEPKELLISLSSNIPPLW